MQIEEATELLDVMARSLAENPGQFHFTINITGTQATSIGGGTGLSVQAMGGEPGSTTIGYQSSLNQPNVEISHATADAAIREQIGALVDALNGLASELRSTTPNRNRMREIMKVMEQSWVPNVITAVVASIIATTVVG